MIIGYTDALAWAALCASAGYVIGALVEYSDTRKERLRRELAESREYATRTKLEEYRRRDINARHNLPSQIMKADEILQTMEATFNLTATELQDVQIGQEVQVYGKVWTIEKAEIDHFGRTAKVYLTRILK